MIIGNPDKFAIYYDIVEDWSNPSFSEGLFFYIVDAKFYPRVIPKESSTLNVCVSELDSMVSHLENTSIDNNLFFNLSMEEAYRELSNLRFIPYREYLQTGQEEDYTYAITVGEMLSYMGEMYLVSSGNKEKVIYKELAKNEFFECIVEKGYVLSVMKKAAAILSSHIEKT